MPGGLHQNKQGAAATHDIDQYSLAPYGQAISTRIDLMRNWILIRRPWPVSLSKRRRIWMAWIML